MSQHRELVAIMFTDIEGYTSLMQNDEKEAMLIRKKHREIFDACTNKHKGELIQYFGDGTLSTFRSSVEAIKCGIEMLPKNFLYRATISNKFSNASLLEQFCLINHQKYNTFYPDFLP